MKVIARIAPLTCMQLVWVREKLRDSQWLARDSCELATRKKISQQADIHATSLRGAFSPRCSSYSPCFALGILLHESPLSENLLARGPWGGARLPNELCYDLRQPFAVRMWVYDCDSPSHSNV